MMIDDIEKQQSDTLLPYDVTMFWEFYRWERYKLGDIYLQIFPNGKMYAGQTTNRSGRFAQYKRQIGSNCHHTNALKINTFERVKSILVACPLYLLDTIETFLISYYDLTDPNKGYNKSSGGRKNWYLSKSSRQQLSESLKRNWDLNPDRRIAYSERMTGVRRPDVSERMSGENNHYFGVTGEKHPLYGTKRTKDTKILISISKKGKINPQFGKKGILSPNFGKIGELNPNYGRKCPEQSDRTSGDGNPMFGKTGALAPSSIPVYVFGNVYTCGQEASDALRQRFKLKAKNFVSNWLSYGQHYDNVFKISKDFYKYAVLCEIENITREFYDIFTNIMMW
jgi:hypothetical protein